MIREYNHHTDWVKVKHLARLMHKESTYRDLDFCEDRLMDVYKGTLEGHYTVFVNETPENNISGMVGGVISPHFFGNDLIVQDLFIYVHENARHGYLGVKLIKQLEAFADKRGAKVVCLGITTGINEERTAKLYEKLGYTYSGSIWKKEIK